MILRKEIVREFRKGLTVMLIPHDGVQAVRVHLNLVIFLFFAATWTVLTLWAGYLLATHPDYLKTRADNIVMKREMAACDREIRETKALLEEVRENDLRVRSLLNMSAPDGAAAQGRGGPSERETEQLGATIDAASRAELDRDIRQQVAQLEKETRRQLDSHREIFRHIDRRRSAVRATPSMWPCVGRVSSRFGMRRHPISRTYEPHYGLDIAGRTNSGIRATADGTVIIARRQSGYGNLIVLRHTGGFVTCYGHLNAFNVKPGQQVRRGQVIGFMGSTGRSTGPHLHYEVRRTGRPVNPEKYLRPSADAMRLAALQ